MRCEKMLISILLPTRKRFELMLKSIESLFKTATNPDEIEILLKLDIDNYEEYLDRIDEVYALTTNLKIVISDRHQGYDSLHLFLNELAGVSSGEFLLVWNDDATMLSNGWDDYIMEHTGKICVIQMKNNHFSKYGIFPIIHRKFYEILNHISLNPHSDYWVHLVADKVGIEIDEFRIEAYHDRADVTGNNNDDVYRGGRGRDKGYATGHKLFHSQEQVDLRSRDANKIFAYLMEN